MTNMLILARMYARSRLRVLSWNSIMTIFGRTCVTNRLPCVSLISDMSIFQNKIKQKDKSQITNEANRDRCVFL